MLYTHIVLSMSAVPSPCPRPHRTHLSPCPLRNFRPAPCLPTPPPCPPPQYPHTPSPATPPAPYPPAHPIRCPPAPLAAARQRTASQEILLWMTPSEAPKALQASECSELLDPTGASYWIFAQRQPGKFKMPTRTMPTHTIPPPPPLRPQKRAEEISGKPKSLKHFANTGRGDLREAQILETLCKNGPRRSPGGPNP